MSKTWDMNALAQILGYKDVELYEARQHIELLDAELERLSVLLIAATTPERPTPAEAEENLDNTVKMLNAASSASNIDTRLEALESSRTAIYLTDLPITLTPEALKDKTIN